MTIYHAALETDGVPAPSEYEPLTRPPSPRFQPFVAVTDRDKLVTIVAQTRAGLYRDERGYLYIPATITRDLTEYAERKAADARDLDDTQQDALW